MEQFPRLWCCEILCHAEDHGIQHGSVYQCINQLIYWSYLILFDLVWSSLIFWFCLILPGVSDLVSSLLILSSHPIYLSTYLPTYLSIYLSTYPAMQLSIYPSVYPSIHLSVYSSIHLSISRSAYLFIYLSIHPFIHLSISPYEYTEYICMFTYIYMYM